ncbi:PREDICTED: transcription factor SOX-9-like [Nelumbo nucifera]|uniref:Transcription factor SOX-9-like n=1 Tax=Nelumbo nucifera TaxID=4432 RepID=A0A1U7ZDJ0_NELNU|nr:PREDICTED: transcription factor SOX-9-like [Nelumbo nucifera]
MVPESERYRIIEIQVRVDCNGCIQKIKKALNGINGIHALYIDIPQQKLTVVGWADPEKIIKAIKKTRKIATICAYTEASDPPAEPSEPAPPAEATPPAEPPKDTPPPPENPPAVEMRPSPVAVDTAEAQPVHLSGPNDVEEIHVINHHHPHDHYYGNGYASVPDHGDGLRNQANQAPVYVAHGYNTYRPSPYISEYEYIHSPPRRTSYSRTEHYSEDYYYSRSNSDGNNITSMFSDENPNACRIV